MPIMTAPVAAPKLPVIEVAAGKTAQVIGKVAQVQGDAWIIRDGQKIVAAKDAPLLKGDEVETAPAAEISLVFADRSTFVLKDRGLIGLDEFTYDPATKTGSESILVAQGAFSFVSGDIAKSAPGAARLATPAMSIGVRGTTVVGSVGSGGETSVALQPDPGSSFVGEISLSRPGSSDAPLVISDAGSGVLGASLGSSFTQSSNAGAVVSSVAPPAAAPPATAPALPAAPAPSGPANAPAGGGASGGGDAGAVAAGGAAAGGGGATAPAAAPAGGGNTEAPVGPAPGGGAEVPVQVVTVVEVPPLPVVPIVPAVVTIGLPGGNGGAPQPLGGAPAANGGAAAAAAAAAAEAPQQPAGTEADLGTGESLPPPTGGTAPPPPPPPPVNGEPVASGLPLVASGTEEVSYTITAAELLARVSDANGDALTLTGAVTADHGSVTDNLDGTFTLTPDPDFHGVMTISYGVSDGSVTITATTLANFANTPDAPVAGSVTLPATNEDTGLVLSLAQLLGSATDADGDPLAITNLSASNGASFTDNGNGTFTITPAANYSGTVSLTYDIDDGTGNQVATSASVVVNAANDAPTMSTYVGMSSPNEDGPFPGETVYALFNTGFSDTADLGTLGGVAVISNNTVSPDGAWQYSSDGGTTWVDVGGVNDNSSALALSASTKLRFNAAPDFHGTAPSLYVRGLDNTYAGGWSSSTGSAVYTNTSSPGGSSAIAAGATELSTDVNAVNDAPVTSTVTLTAGVENVLYTFTSAQLLANAVDVDGDALTIGSITPSTGTVTDLGGGNYTWALPADYNGTASLTYIISDGQGGSVAGSADVSIAAMVTTAGVDTLTAGDGDNAYRVVAGTFAAGDSIIDTGNPADADVIRVTSAGTVDLAAGSVTGIESIAIEASGATTIVLGGGADPQQFLFIGGGPGSDTVQMADSGSTLDLTGIVMTSIDSVSTGAGNDTISFDDVSFAGIGIVVDGDASAVDSDKVIIYQTQAGILDVSASVFSNIETVALVAATSSDVSLIGNSLNNSLVGGTGSDKLTGGAGADTLTGGAGSDVFVYTTPTESANALANRDTITDFTSGTDHIQISVSGAHVDVSGFESVASYNLGQASLTGGVARTGGVIGDCFYAGGVDQALYVWVGNSSSNINTDGGYVIASPTAISAGDLDFNISGTTGTDTLVGGAGNDTLIASLGGDSLTGNGGTDSFVLADNSNTTITDFTVGTDTLTVSNAEFGLGSSGTLAASDYTEGATAMSGTAFNYGATGDGLVAIQSGADVQLWSTTAMEAATTANSVLVGTLNNVNTSALDNTSFHLGV